MARLRRVYEVTVVLADDSGQLQGIAVDIEVLIREGRSEIAAGLAETAIVEATVLEVVKIEEADRPHGFV